MRSILVGVVGVAVCGLAGCDAQMRSRFGLKGDQEPVAASSPGKDAPASFAKVVRSVAPAVVSIDTLSQDESRTPWLDLVPREGATAPS